MSNDQYSRGESGHGSGEEKKRPETDTGTTADQRQVGDNRRAGDMDGNAAGGNSKSKGADNPADDSAQSEGRRDQ